MISVSLEDLHLPSLPPLPPLPPFLPPSLPPSPPPLLPTLPTSLPLPLLPPYQNKTIPPGNQYLAQSGQPLCKAAVPFQRHPLFSRGSHPWMLLSQLWQPDLHRPGKGRGNQMVLNDIAFPSFRSTPLFACWSTLDWLEVWENGMYVLWEWVYGYEGPGNGSI